MAFLVGWGLPSSTLAAEAVYKARLSYHWFPTHLAAQFSEKFAKYAKEATNGRLEITTYGSGQLYSNKTSFMGISKGGVEMAGITDNPIEGIDPIYYVPNTHYFWSGDKGYQEIRYMFRQTSAGKNYDEAFQKKHGVKWLFYLPLGQVALWSKKPILKIEDYKGQKVRTQSQIEKPFFESMGAHPVFIISDEVYIALQQGMIDSFISHPTATKAYDWWASAKFYQQPGVAYNDARMGANLKWWDSLPADIKDIILNKVGPRVEKEALDEIWADHHAILDEFVKKKGGTITKVPPEVHKSYEELAAQKIWPQLQEKLKKERPGMWEAALETREKGKKGLIK